MSLTWHSRSLRSFSKHWATSCSDRSSSAMRAASTITFLDLSSEMEASLPISSKSPCRVCISDSSLLQKSPCLFQSILDRVCLALSSNEVVPSDLLSTLLLFQPGLGIADLPVVLLDSLLCLLVGCVGMLQGSLKLRDIGLQLLLHTKCLSLALALTLQSSLHAINGLHIVLLG